MASAHFETFLIATNMSDDVNPKWKVEDGLTELIANAMDADPDGYQITQEAGGKLIIKNRGSSLEPAHFLQKQDLGKRGSEKKHGGFGCGLKDAVSVLHRNGYSFRASSKHGEFVHLMKSQHPQLPSTSHFQVSAPLDPSTEWTTIAVTPTGLALPLPPVESFHFKPSSAGWSISSVSVYRTGSTDMFAPLSKLYLRGLYPIEIPTSSLPRGLVVNLTDVPKATQDKLGRDRKNRQAGDFHVQLTTARDVAQRNCPELFPVVAAAEPAFYWAPPPARRPMSSGKKSKGQKILERIAAEVKEAVKDLEAALKAEKRSCQKLLAEKEHAHQEHAKSEAAAKATLATMERTMKTLWRQLVVRMPNDAAGIKAWVNAKSPPDILLDTARDVKAKLETRFGADGVYFGGSLSKETALNNGDADFVVNFEGMPPPTINAFPATLLSLGFEEPARAVTDGSVGFLIPNLPTAVVYTTKFNNLDLDITCLPTRQQFVAKIADQKQRDEEIRNGAPELKHAIMFLKRVAFEVVGPTNSIVSGFNCEGLALAFFSHKAKSATTAAAATGRISTSVSALDYKAFLTFVTQSVKSYLQSASYSPPVELAWDRHPMHIWQVLADVCEQRASKIAAAA